MSGKLGGRLTEELDPNILEIIKSENVVVNSNEFFVTLKSQATLTANNRVLTSWAEQTPLFDLEKYELLMSNMTCWLAPTATRLKASNEYSVRCIANALLYGQKHPIQFRAIENRAKSLKMLALLNSGINGFIAVSQSPSP